MVNKKNKNKNVVVCLLTTATLSIIAFSTYVLMEHVSLETQKTRTTIICQRN